MDPTCRQVLQLRMPFLLENLHINPMLTACLVQTGALNDHLVDEITAKVTTNARIECLIQKLKRRGPKAFHTFLTALRMSDQGFIAEDLMLHRKNEEMKSDLKIQDILSQYPTLQRRLSTAQDLPELKRLFAVREDLVQAKKDNMDLQDSIDDMKSEMSKLQRHLEHYKQETEEKQDELNLLNARLDEVTTENERLQQQLQETATHMAMANSLVELDTKLRDPKVANYLTESHDTDDVGHVSNNDNTQITELQKLLKDKDDELQNMKREHEILLDDLNKQFGHLQDEVEIATDDSLLTTGTSAFRSLLNTIAQTILPRQDSPVPESPLQDDFNKAQAKISHLERKVDSLNQAKHKLRARLNKTKKSLSLTQAEVKRMACQITTEQEHNRTLKSILDKSQRRESMVSNSTISSSSSDENADHYGTSNVLTVGDPPFLPPIQMSSRHQATTMVTRIKIPAVKTSQPVAYQNITFPSPS